MTTINNADKTLFSKIYLVSNNRDLQSLKDEEKDENKATIKAQALAKITQDTSNYQAVIFNNGEDKIKVLLSKDNLAKLQENFDKNNFYSRQDRAIRLSGKAESYVSGWYSEIAQNMGFNKADINKDGKISQNEAAALKDSYTFDMSKNNTTYGDDIFIYNVQSYAENKDSSTKTMDSILNDLIKADKDLSGKVTLQEHIESTKGNLANALKSILKSQENPFEYLTQEIKLKSKEKVEEEVSKEEAAALLAKIKQSGDLSTLSPKEQEAVRQYFANEVSKIKQENSDADIINRKIDAMLSDFANEILSDDSKIFETKA